MTKREYPFSTTFETQEKWHITDKKVDKGVANLQNMRKVYERTRNLLYEGSKINQPPCIDLPTTPPREVPSALSNSLLVGQRFIQSSGGMIKLTNEVEQKADRSYTLNAYRCGCLTKMKTERCLSCLKILCSNCLFVCGKCTNGYCEKCVSDWPFERVTRDTENVLCRDCYY